MDITSSPIANPPSPVSDIYEESMLLPLVQEKWVDMKDLLCCPVCVNLFKGRINQCLNGHSYCQDCRATMINCPLCREPLSRTRNYALEGVIALCGFKCKYYEQGCRKQVTIGEQEQHNTTCGYRSMWCATLGFDQCKKGTTYTGYLPHLATEHGVRTEPNEYFKQGNYFERRSAVTTSREKFVDGMITFDRKTFILQFKMLDEHRLKIETVQDVNLNRIVCCWWVSVFTPSENDCNDYICRICVRSKVEGRVTSCNLSWEGRVMPLRAKAKDICKTACLATTLGNILETDLESAKDNGEKKYMVAYEISAVIDKIPALVPELNEVPVQITNVACEERGIQTNPLPLLAEVSMENAAILWESLKYTASKEAALILDSPTFEILRQILQQKDVIFVVALVSLRFLCALLGTVP